MAKDPLSDVTKLESSLRNINRELDKTVQKLGKISQLFGSSYQNVRGTISTGLGNTGNQVTQTSSASFSTGGMPFMYSRTGTGLVAGAQALLGTAGAGMAAAPDTGLVMARAAGYYNMSRVSFGGTRGGIAAASLQALRGGITGMGEDVAAANVLSLGYGYMPNSSSYLRAMREVGGAALGYNMANATAAQAIAGMHTGSMGANLYQYGISTIDVKTGQTRAFGDIAKQLYQRQTQGRKLTAAQLEFSMREGFMAADFNALGFSPHQQELLRAAYTNFAQGKEFNLENEMGADNPMSNIYRINASQTSLAENKTDAYIKGTGLAADTVEKVNAALNQMPDSLFKFKSALDTFFGTNAGKGASNMLQTVAAVGGTLLAGSAFRKLVGGAGVRAAGGAAAAGAGSMAATVGLTALGSAGVGYLSGKAGNALGVNQTVSTLGGAAAGAGTGALIGSAFMPGPGTIVGSIVGAIAGGVGAYFGGKKPATPGSSAVTPAAISKSGNPTEVAWASELLTKIGAPQTDQNLAAITTWMRYEGGGGGKSTGLGVNSAMYNPLNTTQGAPGATSMNSVGVKSYNSWNQGMDATVQTLMNGKYSGILATLRQGNDANAVLQQVNASPWGTKIAGVGMAAGTAGAITINLKIDKASDAEAIAFAKKVKEILAKDNSLAALAGK